MIWTRLQPPKYQPDAILTKRGWVHPKTGELLICMKLGYLGPGKGLEYTIQGQSNISGQSQKQIQAGCLIHRSGRPETIDAGARVTKAGSATQFGKARIIKASCPTPINTGINPSWSTSQDFSSMSAAELSALMAKVIEAISNK